MLDVTLLIDKVCFAYVTKTGWMCLYIYYDKRLSVMRFNYYIT